MIRFILLQNRAGKTRLAKYYIPLDDTEKHGLEYEVHRLIATRDPKFTNFVEASLVLLLYVVLLYVVLTPLCYVQFKTNKVIYRRYAGLFFSMCVDVTDNELAYLESVHLFVEILDHYFSNVCELDLVFNFHKVSSIFTSCSLTVPEQRLSWILHGQQMRHRKEHIFQFCAHK